MSLSEDVSKRLDALKKAAQDFTIFVNSIDSKKFMKETDASQLELRIAKLKKDAEDAQNRANLIIRKADEEASAKIANAKKMMDNAHLADAQIAEDKKQAQVLKNEAEALMNQAKQRQKEA